MQEEQIGHDAGAKYRRHCTEEPREQPRHDVRYVVIRMGHHGTPDLADKRTEHTPEDDRAAAQTVGDRREKEWPCGHTGQGSRVLHEC